MFIPSNQISNVRFNETENYELWLQSIHNWTEYHVYIMYYFIVVLLLVERMHFSLSFT